MAMTDEDAAIAAGCGVGCFILALWGTIIGSVVILLIAVAYYLFTH